MRIKRFTMVVIDCMVPDCMHWVNVFGGMRPVDIHHEQLLFVVYAALCVDGNYCLVGGALLSSCSSLYCV